MTEIKTETGREMKKTIELKVNGEIVGTAEVFIDDNKKISRVTGEGLLRHGSYLMTPDELKSMIEKKASKDYQGTGKDYEVTVCEESQNYQK